MSVTGIMRYLTIGDATYEVYNTNDDTKVYQSYKAAADYSYWRPLLIGYSATSTETAAPEDQTNLAYTFNTLKVQPSSGTIRVGAVSIYNGNYTATIDTDTLSANRTITLPNKTGIVALTSDIPSVPAWALEPSKPTYIASEVGALPNTTIIPSKTSDLTNDSGFITSYTETDPVFSASAAAGISAADINNWNGKTSNVGTVTSVGVVNATNGGLTISGSPITSSGSITIGHSNVLSSAQTTQAVYPIKIDKNGHISAYGSAVTIPTIPNNNVTGSGSTNYLARWSGTNTLSGTSLYINTSYNSSSDLYGTIKLYVGSTGQIDWRGQLVFHDGSSSKTITITPPSLTTSRTITLPDKSGTVALTSDTPSITLNGSTTTTPSFYAPTSAGTSGQVLTSNGSGAPTWTNAGSSTDEKLALSEITAGITYYPIVGTGTTAATRQYDTTGFIYVGTNGTANGTNGNALLTLGNSTASTTANWKKGTIRLYGTTAYYTDLVSGAPSANRTITFPNATGTVALTSDIPTVPSSTESATTGITASTTATKTTLGTATSIYGVKSGTNSTTTASKASGSNGSASTWVFEDITTDDITGWSAGSGSASFSATVSNHVLSFSHSHTHTAPTLTYTEKTSSHVKSGGNGTAPSWSFTDVTVPIRADSATSVPNVSTATATVTITDPGHTHTL